MGKHDKRKRDGGDRTDNSENPNKIPRLSPQTAAAIACATDQITDPTHQFARKHGFSGKDGNAIAKAAVDAASAALINLFGPTSSIRTQEFVSKAYEASIKAGEEAAAKEAVELVEGHANPKRAALILHSLRHGKDESTTAPVPPRSAADHTIKPA